MFYRKITFIFILLLSGSAIYLNTIHCPFVFDDNVSIVNEKNIRMATLSLDSLKKASTQTFYTKAHFRPIVMISFALNYYIDGYHPRLYHIVNIVIHLLSIIGTSMILCFSSTHPL